MRQITSKQSLLAVAVIFIIYCGWISVYTLQAPGSEDVDTSLRPILEFYQSQDAKESYSKLTQPHARHSLLVSRLAGIASYEIFDYVNFKFVYLIGALLVFLIIFLIALDQHNREYSAAIPASGNIATYLIIFSLFLLNPAFRTGTFAMWGVSNFSSISFALAALWFLQFNTLKSLIAFQFFAYLAINSQGNALLVPLIGLLIYGHRAFTNRAIDNTRLLFAHIFFTIVILKVYFLPEDTSGISYADVYQHLLNNPINELLFSAGAFFIWVGHWVVISESAMHMNPVPALWGALAVGMGQVLFILICLLSRWRTLLARYPFRFLSLIYLLLTIAGASLDRTLTLSYISQSTDFQSLSYVLSSRYSFYSLTLLVLFISLSQSVYLSGEEQAAERKAANIQYAILLVAFVYCLARYWAAIPNMDQEKARLTNCMTAWHQHGEAKPCLWHGRTGALMHDLHGVGLLRVDNPGGGTSSQ